MSSSAVLSVRDDGQVTTGREGPRADRPARRRAFTPTEKLDHLAAYEAACERHQGGAYLRSEGLYSSQVTEWRKHRDAGLLAGKQSGVRVGRPSAEQAEIARLRRDLAAAERKPKRQFGQGLRLPTVRSRRVRVPARSARSKTAPTGWCPARRTARRSGLW